MRRHILPNVVNLIVANAVLIFAGAVLTETTLSFIGLGDPFQPSWGQLLDAAQAVGRTRPRGLVVHRPAGACIVLVVLAFTLSATPSTTSSTRSRRRADDRAGRAVRRHRSAAVAPPSPGFARTCGRWCAICGRPA